MTNASCPITVKRGRRVPLVTLRSLVRSEHLAAVEGREWFFCELPDCDVVYFTDEGRSLDKGALKTPGEHQG